MPQNKTENPITRPSLKSKQQSRHLKDAKGRALSTHTQIFRQWRKWRGAKRRTNDTTDLWMGNILSYIRSAIQSLARKLPNNYHNWSDQVLCIKNTYALAKPIANTGKVKLIPHNRITIWAVWNVLVNLIQVSWGLSFKSIETTSSSLRIKAKT